MMEKQERVQILAKSEWICLIWMCKPKFWVGQMKRWLDGVKKWGKTWRMTCWTPKKHAGTRK